jgi:hypothetical protein
LPNKYFLIILSFLLIISCNKNGANKNVQKHDDLTNVEKLASDTDKKLKTLEEEIAVINSDCSYFLDHSDTSSGKLKKGQSVIISDYYYVEEINDNFNIYVKVETLDKTVKGSVLESYLTYPNNHNIWFKNIIFTRSYYYTESAENICKKEYLLFISEGVSEIDSIRMTKHFFSENRILISERHFIIGNSNQFSIYKILSIYKNNENTYLLNLLDYYKKTFELVLLVDNNSITITQFVTENEIYNQNNIEYELNIKYIAYNREKSEKVKKDVSAWCSEQLKKF